MQVLYLCHRIPYPPNKGEKIRAFHQIRALASRHDVDLFTLADEEVDPAHVEALREYCRDVHVVRINRRMSRIRALPHLLTRTALTLPVFYSSALDSAVKEALANREYGCAFVYSSAMAQYVRNAGLRVVTDLVDVDSDKWMQYARMARFPLSSVYRREAYCLREVEREICRTSSAVLLATEREARLMREILPGARVTVSPNGVDTAYFERRGKPHPDPTAVFTGDMSYLPNEDAVTYFADAVFPLVRQRVPQARFLIVGRDPSKRVRRLAAIEGVEVTGRVPDVRPYLEQAQVFVAPFSFSTGIPNKLLEAMSFGLPVVSTACGVQGLSSMAQKSVAVAGNAQEFAARVLEFFSDPELASARGAECRQRVLAGYRWESALEGLLKIVETPQVVSFPAFVS